MFESTLAYNRLQSLQRLRHAGTRAEHQRVFVHRGRAAPSSSITRQSPASFSWMAIPVNELVPGDLVSLNAELSQTTYGGEQYTAVPADVLLLSGTAVTDEALLTGESIPQLKHALDVTAATNATNNNTTTSTTSSLQRRLLDIQDAEHKESVLFGGTILLASNAPEAEETDFSSSETTTVTPTVTAPPDGGVFGIVLRTGFETTQGNLLRTMAHSSKQVDGIHTADTFVFVFILICCAVVAAWTVLQDGWLDDRRNRFRLILHVIIIVTSTVPPELPMELSLAVTNAVQDLVRRCRVWCTELYRIPAAGQVTMACFDKTGTLTCNIMEFKKFSVDGRAYENG